VEKLRPSSAEEEEEGGYRPGDAVNHSCPLHVKEGNVLELRVKNQFSKSGVGRQPLEILVTLGLNAILGTEGDGLLQVLQSIFSIAA